MKPRGRRFQKVNVEISNICNLQCSFCPEVEREKKRISIDDFRNVIRQIAPLTELVCFHLMGDPLVHPHLDELVDICEELGTRIFFVTNGVLLRDESVRTLLRPAFYQLNFSLHSYPDNYPERPLEPYLEKIFRLTERALTERPDLYLNYRLWNLDDPRGTNPKNREILARIEDRFGFRLEGPVDVRARKGYRVRERLSLHFDTEFVWPAMDLPVLGDCGTCLGLKSHFGVLVDGTVVPCCLDKEGAIPLGNLNRTPLTEILASDRAQRILAGFRQRKLVEDLCRRCQYIERFG